MATLFDLLRDGAIHPVVIDRRPLAAAREVLVWMVSLLLSI